MDRRRYLLAAGSTAVAIGGVGLVANQANGGEADRLPMALDEARVTQSANSNIEIQTAISREKISSERTATLTFSVVWHGEEKRGLRFGNAIPFTDPQKSQSPPGLLLVDAESRYSRTDSETWVPDIGNADGLSYDLGVVSEVFTPGETIQNTWEVWADPTVRSRILPGEYTFESSIRLQRGDSVEGVPWTLTVTIAD